MTLRQLPLTGSNGTAITAANTNATPTLQTGCTGVFDSTVKGVDITGITLSSSSSGTLNNNNASLRWVPSGAANASMAFEFVFTLPATAPSANLTIFRPRMTSGSGPQVQIRPDGRLLILDVGGTGRGDLATVGSPLTFGSKYRLAFRGVTGSGTGSLAAAVYVWNSTTPVTSGTASATNIEMGTSTFAGFDGGVIGGLASQTIIGISDIQINDGATSFIGPWVSGANQLPTVTQPSSFQNVTAGATVTLSGFSATDPDGTIASVATTYGTPSTSQPALANGTSLSTAPTFTAGSSGALHTLVRTYTDNSGGTGVGATEVRVPADTSLAALALAATKTGTVTRTGSATTDGGAISDADDTTYLELTSGSSFVIRGNPIKTQTSYAVTFRLKTPGAGTAVCALYQGSYAPNGTPTLTQIQASSTLTLTSSWADYVLTITSPGSISDAGNLWVGVAAS